MSATPEMTREEVLSGLVKAVKEISGYWNESVDNWMQAAAQVMEAKPPPLARDGSSLSWLVVNPDGKLLAILDSASEAYWFTRNRGHAEGAVYFKAPLDYATAPVLLAANKALVDACKEVVRVYNRSDCEHATFADSCADVVEDLGNVVRLCVLPAMGEKK